MRVIVAGSRDLELNMEQFERLLKMINVTLLVNGMCPTGIDRTARMWAKKHGVKVQAYPADWSKDGRAAGPIRNRRMAENADMLVAIMKKDGSAGTQNMIDEAKLKGLKVVVYIV